jgi:mannan endo-1,4-beta-mannosidase
MSKSKRKKRHIGIPVVVITLLFIFSSLFFYSLLSRYSRNEHKITNLPPLAGAIKPPKKGAFMGVSLYDQNIVTLNNVEKDIGKHFAIVGIYQSWEGSHTEFDSNWAQNVFAQGSTPLITWEPWIPVSGYDRSEDKVNQGKYRLIKISQGNFDPYIRQYADSIRAYHMPVMIRFAHEMNGNWYPWGSTFNTPQDYIAAWRHVHNIFAKEGATNVTWVWSPNAIYYDPHIPYSSQIEKFYPGNAYVDWVGLSAFNWAGQYKQNVWMPPDEIFSSTVDELATFQKPIIIAETASADTNSPITKANWIRALAMYMKNNPEIKGIIWFNTTDNGIDWSIESTKLSQSAFTEAFDSYFIQKTH